MLALLRIAARQAPLLLLPQWNVFGAYKSLLLLVVRWLEEGQRMMRTELLRIPHMLSGRALGTSSSRLQTKVGKRVRV